MQRDRTTPSVVERARFRSSVPRSRRATTRAVRRLHIATIPWHRSVFRWSCRGRLATTARCNLMSRTGSTDCGTRQRVSCSAGHHPKPAAAAERPVLRGRNGGDGFSFYGVVTECSASPALWMTPGQPGSTSSSIEPSRRRNPGRRVTAQSVTQRVVSSRSRLGLPPTHVRRDSDRRRSWR
jgi:hypothetical protein